jgi:hypothetical protein
MTINALRKAICLAMRLHPEPVGQLKQTQLGVTLALGQICIASTGSGQAAAVGVSPADGQTRLFMSSVDGLLSCHTENYGV